VTTSFQARRMPCLKADPRRAGNQSGYTMLSIMSIIILYIVEREPNPSYEGR